MTSDEQEAESRKYSLDVVNLLPLSSGKWAVFNAALKLERIIDFPLTLLALQVTRPEVRQPNPTTSSRFNADDLDL